MSNPKVAAAVTQKLMDAIESGVKPWEKPWVHGGGPVNHFRKNRYRGINVLTLTFVAMEREYEYNRWFTFHQAKTAGHRLHEAKGMGVPVLYFRLFDKKEDGEVVGKVAMMRYTRAFNIAHLPTLEWEPEPLPEGVVPVDMLEAHIIEQTALDRLCPVKDDGGDRAFYRPGTDSVHMPVVKQFKATEGYYSTLLHEFAHSTGHSSRLDRDLTGSFGSDKYAFEEAIAEMTGCMLLGEFGIDADIPNSASYLDGWLPALKKNPGLLSQAAHNAQKAADYFMNRYQDKQEEDNEPSA